MISMYFKYIRVQKKKLYVPPGTVRRVIIGNRTKQIPPLTGNFMNIEYFELTPNILIVY